MSLSLSWQPRQHWFRKQPDQFKRARAHPINIKEGKLFCQSSVTSLSLFCQQFLADYQTYSKNPIPCLSVDSAHEKGWTSASGFLPNGLLWQSTLFIYSFSGCERGQVSLRVHVEETQRTTIQCLFLEITLNKLDTEAVERGQTRLDDHLALAVSLTPNWYACQFFSPQNNNTLCCQSLFRASDLERGGERERGLCAWLQSHTCAFLLIVCPSGLVVICANSWGVARATRQIEAETGRLRADTFKYTHKKITRNSSPAPPQLLSAQIRPSLAPL